MVSLPLVEQFEYHPKHFGVFRVIPISSRLNEHYLSSADGLATARKNLEELRACFVSNVFPTGINCTIIQPRHVICKLIKFTLALYPGLV